MTFKNSREIVVNSRRRKFQLGPFQWPGREATPGGRRSHFPAFHTPTGHGNKDHRGFQFQLPEHCCLEDFDRTTPSDSTPPLGARATPHADAAPTRHHSHGRLEEVLSPRPRAARPSHAVPTRYETTRGARTASPIEGLVDMCRRDPVASLGSHGTGARTHQRCVWLCRVSRQMCQDAPAAR